jgi:hypothetical protein
MNRTATLFILLLALVVLTGCTSTPAGGGEIAQDTIRAHYQHQGDWSFGLGCFEKVSGYAYNAGNTTKNGVMLNFNLIDNRSGTIRDSRSVFLGTVVAGQSRTFESDLDGECIPDYRVEGTIVP